MSPTTIVAKNSEQTKKMAGILAKECLKTAPHKRALVIALEGNLGGGKTTFVQGFAKGLGIKEKITSPTFVLLKIFKLPIRRSHLREGFKRLIHIDAYRLERAKELKMLSWKEFLSDSQSIIIIEWADKVRRLLPKDYIQVKFKHIKGDEREIVINSKFKEQKSK